MSNSREVILDACAIIAYLNDEEGAATIDRLVAEERVLSIAAIKALEVAYDAVKLSGTSDTISEVSDAINAIPCRIEWTMSWEVFARAAEFKAHNRISLADSVALALARTKGARLATSDHHEFDSIEKQGEVSFLWIR